MGTTTRGYPYPELADDNDVPADMLALATAIDTDMTASAGVSVLDRVRSTTTVVNSTTETDLYRKTIVGGTLGTDGGLRLRLGFDALNNSGGVVNYRWRVKFGSTTILDTNTNAISLSNSANRFLGMLEVVLLDETASAQRMSGNLRLSSPVPASTSFYIDNSGSSGLVGYGVATEDTTVNKDLAVTIQLATASASADIRRQMALLEKVNHS